MYVNYDFKPFSAAFMPVNYKYMSSFPIYMSENYNYMCTFYTVLSFFIIGVACSLSKQGSMAGRIE